MKNPYQDIIHLPHPVSSAHPSMPIIDRAAQFAPFAALTGFEAAIKETARLTDKRVELDEYEKEALNGKLLQIANQLEERPKVTIVYFQKDERKNGGAYVTLSGRVKKIDDYERAVLMTDGRKVPIEEIRKIEN